ncbi:serine hydrolase-like protein [Plodia interpunctella]|uniref:serine hydrolase-like protein n=1 Tax=Plodia interpunctella TaxID=58824 RepID=UPI002367FD0B|nr:serine hydrolase-like protein [Plodia interpunctella]
MTLPENEWFIQAPWGRICLVAWGDCFNPPVLLVHGARDTAATFRPLVSLLPNNFYYIAIELPGNGRSDRYPPGMMISVYDLVYVVTLVVRHFRWDKFIFVGHSMGTLIGKLYNISYKGSITKMVELDPVTKWITVPPHKFADWYHKYFTAFYEQYEKLNSPKEKSPSYTYQQAIDTLKEGRRLTQETAAATVDRMTEPAGRGRVKFTADRRYKFISTVPFAPDHLKRVFTGITTPTLNIVAENSLKKGYYKGAEFLLDESCFAGNYRIRKVDGGHDVHFVNPDRVAPFVTQFLLYGVEGVNGKPKL